MSHAKCPLCGQVHEEFDYGFSVSLYRCDNEGELLDCRMNGFDCETTYGPELENPDAETYEEAVEKAYELWDKAFGGDAA